MPDTRVHRGAHPRDRECFTPDSLPKLRAAVADLSWLLDRSYTKKSALKLVGDRYALRDRQRKALQRSAAGDADCRRRQATRVDAGALQSAVLLLDGYNVLLTIEAALSGGLLLLARDGTLRDLTAMSRHYRRVRTTLRALEILGEFSDQTQPETWIWYFDRPVSNSARLKTTIDQLASSTARPWKVHLVANPDAVLSASTEIVATADSGILDRGPRWFNLAREVVSSRIPGAWTLDLSR